MTATPNKMSSRKATKAIKTLVGAILVLAIGVIGLSGTDVNAATTRTFTSTATFGINFSNPDNWNPAGVPTAEDDIIIDSSVSTHISIGAHQAVRSITILPDDAGNCIGLFSSATMGLSLNRFTLTVGNGGINASGCNRAPTFIPNIALSDNAVFNNITIGQASNQNLILNINEFTLRHKGGRGAQGGDIMYHLRGNGSVIVDLATGHELRFRGNNGEFTGDFTITQGSLVEFWGNNVANMFGDAESVTMEENSRVRLHNTNSSASFAGAITNRINMSEGTRLTFGCLNVGCSGEWIMSGIELLGNMSLENQMRNLTVNLAGTESNGFCVNYIPNAERFINGPTACVVDSGGTTGSGGGNLTNNTDLPGVPDSGWRDLLLSNPLVIFIVGVLSAAGIAIVIKNKKSQAKK